MDATVDRKPSARAENARKKRIEDDLFSASLIIRSHGLGDAAHRADAIAKTSRALALMTEADLHE